MVVEGEVLNDLPRFISILVAEFAAGGMVNLTLKMKGDMIIKKFEFEANDRCHDENIFVVDIVAEFYGPSWRKELSKEMSSKILPCGDGSCWKTFKPIAGLITKEN
ncbi:hypothetical protein Tco_1133694 [Tanacetum coccineum]